MKKILFIDLLCQLGNRHVDNYVMNIMAKENEVYLLMNDDFIVQNLTNKKNIHILGNKLTNNEGGGLKRAFGFLKRMKLAAYFEKQINPDLIYVSAYETRTFWLGLCFFKNPEKIVVVENYNIDFLKDKTQDFAYRKFAPRVHHMVYEPLFKDYLTIAYNLDESKVHCVPHIQYMKEMEVFSGDDTKNIYDCIAISGSNDVEMVREIVNKEEKDHFFSSNKIRCLIKCRAVTYESDYLNVVGKFIPTKEYNELYSKTKMVLVPFPLSYKYRMSGCIVDAFSHRKPVVSSEIELSKYYAKKYGNIISTAVDVDNMLKEIKRILENYNESLYNFDKFAFDHSPFEVERCLSTMINEISNYN